MRFGICCSADRAEAMMEAGFDYVETGAYDLPAHVGVLSALPTPATNLFFPGDFRLFTPTHGDPLEHARGILPAAAELGVKVMVVGSGAQRRFPSEINSVQALDAFVDLIAQMQTYATPFGITLAPESLNRQETNLGNDLSELALALQKRGLSYTADSYHVLRERGPDGTPIDWERELPTAPAHVHLANFPRTLPEPGDSAVRGFLRRLHVLDYDACISFEGSLAEVPPARAAERMRELWKISSTV